MVLGVRLASALAVTALVGCSAAPAARDGGAGESALPAKQPDAAGSHQATTPRTYSTLQIGGESVELVALYRTCGLRHAGQLIELKLPKSCRFLARGAGVKPTVEDYGKAGAIALVAGPIANADDYAEVDDRKQNDQCSHLAQAVFVRNGKVTVGEPLVSPLGFCAQSAPDEKYYYGLAHAGA